MKDWKDFGLLFGGILIFMLCVVLGFSVVTTQAVAGESVTVTIEWINREKVEIPSVVDGSGVVTKENDFGIDPVLLQKKDPGILELGVDKVKTFPATEMDYYLLENSSLTEITDDFASFCAAIHHEAGPYATMQSKIAVGNVIVNRLRDYDNWEYKTLNDVIFDDDQFAVIDLKEFYDTKDAVKSGVWDEDLQSTVMSAYLILTGSDLYAIPEEVCFFYGDPNKRSWGKHEYCFTVGGNSFFK